MAEQALDDAQALLDDDPATQPRDAHDATLALRDLAAPPRRPLRPTSRPAPSAWPPDPGQRAEVRRVHLRPLVDDRRQRRDPPTPSANKVLTTMERVHRTYVRAGYRAPKADNGQGGNAKRDIYLATSAAGPVRLLRQRPAEHRAAVAGLGLLRRSTTTTRRPSSRPTPRSRTCGSRPPTSTSTPCSSPTTTSRTAGSWRPPPPGPRTSCTTASTTTGATCASDSSAPPAHGHGHQTAVSLMYGQWIFFRYLTERMPASKGGLPTLVRNMWEAAEYSPGHGPVLAAGRPEGARRPEAGLRRDLRRLRGGQPAAGPGLRRGSPATRAARAFTSPTLSSGKRSSGWKTDRLDHLTSRPRRSGAATWAAAGSSGEGRPGAAVRGSRAMVTVFRTSGAAQGQAHQPEPARATARRRCRSGRSSPARRGHPGQRQHPLPSATRPRTRACGRVLLRRQADRPGPPRAGQGHRRPLTRSPASGR